MLQLNPTRRISASDALEQPFIVASRGLALRLDLVQGALVLSSCCRASSLTRTRSLSVFLSSFFQIMSKTQYPRTATYATYSHRLVKLTNIILLCAGSLSSQYRLPRNVSQGAPTARERERGFIVAVNYQE